MLEVDNFFWRQTHCCRKFGKSFFLETDSLLPKIRQEFFFGDRLTVAENSARVFFWRQTHCCGKFGKSFFLETDSHSARFFLETDSLLPGSCFLLCEYISSASPFYHQLKEVRHRVLQSKLVSPLTLATSILNQ